MAKQIGSAIFLKMDHTRALLCELNSEADVDLHLKLARVGEYSSMVQIAGYFHSNGDKKIEYGTQALYWYHRCLYLPSSDKEDKEAEKKKETLAEVCYFLGNIYYKGKYGILKDEKVAFRLFLLGATLAKETKWTSWCEHDLGFCFEHGCGVPVDHHKAFYYFSLAANRGHADSMARVGQEYWLGNIVEQNFDTARMWYTRSAALECKTGYEGLATLYRHCSQPSDLSPNYEMVKKYYEKAIELGHSEAPRLLSALLYHGFIPCSDRKMEALRTAEKGLSMVRTEKGVEIYKNLIMEMKSETKLDEPSFFKCMQHAEHWSSSSESIEAQFQLAECQWYGWGVIKNTYHAKAKYRMVANKGHKRAQQWFRLIDAEDKSAADDVDVCIAQYLHQASNCGDVHAQFKMATIYEEGLGVKVNHEEATKWYRLAANNGCRISQGVLSKFRGKEIYLPAALPLRIK